MTLVPLVVLLSLEGVLRLCRVGYATGFFMAAGDGMLTTNPKFGWQFHSRQSASMPTPVLFSKVKPPGTKRVFVLGESAAVGTPDPAFSFSRMLDLMLQQEFPSNRVEVINAAMRGIDSHIIRQIAAECARLSPDLFVVYMGNNEMIGLHAPSPNEANWFKKPAFIQFEHAVKCFRIAQWMESLLRHASKQKRRQQDMAYMRQQRIAFDDPAREITYRNYRANLESICDSAVRANAKAIVCSVAVNLRDQAPLQSMHRADLSAQQLEQWNKLYDAGAKAEGSRNFAEAMTQFRAAAKIDDHFAELLFRLARCEETAGEMAQARKHFSAARDWDALQFRTDSRINDAAREVAAHYGTNLVQFVDVAETFAHSALAAQGVPGEALFEEYVHCTFDGDHLIAATLFGPASAALGMKSKGPPPLTRGECAQRLAYTKVEEANVFSAVAHMISKPPFLDELEHNVRLARFEARARDALRSLTTNDLIEAESIYRNALAQRSDDWMLHYNYGRFLTESRRHADAIPEFERVVKMFPHQCTLRLSLGNALLEARRANDAVAELTTAVKLNPDLIPAKQALAAALAQAR
jgi:tetratricopeptide (TPR) repeat protein